MKPRLRQALHFFIAATCALAIACASKGPKPDQPIVKSIRVQGAKQVSAGEIKEKILTSATGWWPLADKQYFDANAWQADLRRIERVYRSEGYYQAKVTEERVEPLPNKRVALTVKIDEGKPTRIENLNIDGLSVLESWQQRAIFTVLPLKKGDVFEEEPWEGVKKAVLAKLLEWGYATASVTGSVDVDVDTQKASVNLEIVPGELYRFGDTFVSTDAEPHVDPRRVVEQAKGSIKEGRVFTQSLLSEAQSRVFGMGVFGAVKVSRGTPNPQTGVIPIVVDVREAPFHSVRTGGGLGLDQLRQEGHVMAEYVDRNFFGDLRRLTARAKAGWAFLPTVFDAVNPGLGQTTRSEPIGRASLELEQPGFLARDLRLQTSLNAERGVEPAYVYTGGRVKAGIAWKPRPHFTIYPSYNLEAYHLTGLLNGSGTAPALTYGCANAGSGACNVLLSYVEQLIEWDRRDDRNEPHYGHYWSLMLQEGGGPLRGDFNFIKVEPEVRGYLSFGKEKRWTVAGKLKLGSLVNLSSGKTTPIVSRFFAGGGASMRGFNTRRLSPLLAVLPYQQHSDGVANPLGTTAQTVPIGGNGLLESSFEVRYNIVGDLILAAFFDVGMVTEQNLTQDGFNLKGLYLAAGIGARYRTPIGPIRIDIARRLNIGPPLPIDNPSHAYIPAQSGCFGIRETNNAGISGAPESPCVLHVSIGEAF